MLWRRLLVIGLTTVLFLAAAAAYGVVKDHHDGDCWPWQDRVVLGDGTLCDGKPHRHHFIG